MILASALKHAIKLCGRNVDLLCEEIINIVLKNPLGSFISILFIIYSYVVEHSTQTSSLPPASSLPVTNIKQMQVKKTIPETIRGWFRHP